MPPSHCPVCQEYFDNWFEYHQHVNLSHGVAPTAIQTEAWKPKPIKKGEYKGPMDKQLKRSIVRRGESRLGKQHFLGVDQ